jgi:hypothetical protein
VLAEVAVLVVLPLLVFVFGAARQGRGRVSTVFEPQIFCGDWYLSLSAFAGDCGEVPLDSCLDDVSDPGIDDS